MLADVQVEVAVCCAGFVAFIYLATRSHCLSQCLRADKFTIISSNFLLILVPYCVFQARTQDPACENSGRLSGQRTGHHSHQCALGRDKSMQAGSQRDREVITAVEPIEIMDDGWTDGSMPSKL